MYTDRLSFDLLNMRAHAIGQFSRIRPIPAERIARYPEAFLPRLARAFHRLAGLRHECAATVYFINPPVCILSARVSSLIPTGKTMATSASCARVNVTFCIASRRVDGTTKARARTHYVVICSRWYVSRRKARCGSSGACDIRSLRASTRSFPLGVAVLCPASQMLRDD